MKSPYGSDEHGNTISMPHLSTLVWDHLDRMVTSARQVAELPETTYYVYDAEGRRLRKITCAQANGAKLRERVYLDAFEVYRELSAGAITLERETLHVMDGERRLALTETRVDGVATVAPAVRYQLANHLGSAVVEVDDSMLARLISHEEYYPFGSTSYQDRGPEIYSSKRYRYVGQERDEESGFGYCIARYYAPWLGRWTSCDPLGLIEGPNRYPYARNAPTTRSDPSGSASDPFDSNKALGNIREGFWRLWAESQSKSVLAETKWKDPLVLTQKGTPKTAPLGIDGTSRRLDFVLLDFQGSGKNIALEVGSARSVGISGDDSELASQGFEPSSATKRTQMLKDREALRRGLVVGNVKDGYHRVDEVHRAPALPIVDEGGNVPSVTKVAKKEVSPLPRPAARSAGAAGPKIPETPSSGASLERGLANGSIEATASGVSKASRALGALGVAASGLEMIRAGHDGDFLGVALVVGALESPVIASGLLVSEALKVSFDTGMTILSGIAEATLNAVNGPSTHPFAGGF